MDFALRARRRGLLAVAAMTLTMAVFGMGATGARAAHCGGLSIQGQGSSLQSGAQTIWTLGSGTKGFNTNTAGGGCTLSGDQPGVEYVPSSSAACLNGFGANGAAIDTTFAFCGTDQAPSEAQQTSITATAGGAKPLSVAVAQSAIAVVVNGTAVHGSLTWTDLQGRTVPATNVTWPRPTSTTSPLVSSTSGCASSMALPCSGTGSGGGDEVQTVGATAGAIGYAALSDARSVIAANGATWPTLKWLPITVAGTARNPSTNGFSTTKAQSNCSINTGSYSPQPSAGTTGDWSQTYLTSPGTGYPICTLTWDLALTDYDAAGFSSGTDVAQTVKDYLHYATTTAGGQVDALGSANDYATLPTDVRATATAGVAAVLAPPMAQWRTANSGNYTANSAGALGLRFRMTDALGFDTDLTCAGNPTLTGIVNATPAAAPNPWSMFATGAITVGGACTIGMANYGVTCAAQDIATGVGEGAFVVTTTTLEMKISCVLDDGMKNCTTVDKTVVAAYSNRTKVVPAFFSVSTAGQKLVTGGSMCAGIPANAKVTLTDNNGQALIFVVSVPPVGPPAPRLWWG
jgi:hypothetical protein